MKINDIVCRKDTPQFAFKIVAESKDWHDFWIVEPLARYRGFGRWVGQIHMIAKNDDRWEVVRDKDHE